jgi:hypothetical protein
LPPTGPLLPGRSSDISPAANRLYKFFVLLIPLLLCHFGELRQARAQQPHPTVLAANELPDAPGPQLPTQTSLGTVTGTLTDRDGDSISGARVVLTREGKPSTETRTTPDGRFSFPGIPLGPYKLTLSVPGFASQQLSGTLRPGETLSLPAVALAASSNTDVQVTATQADIAQAQIQEAEKQRVLGFLPNFYVSYDSNPVPLKPRQKIELAYKTTLDPVTFALAAALAGVQQGANTYPSWGQDAPAYGKRFAAAYWTFLTGTLIGNAVLPVVLKQDPRYFVKGTGSTRSRVLYALANSVICKGDNMRWQPNYSSILGNLAASGISNFYYPAADREGASLTFENAALGIAATGAGNLFQEFVVRRLTPHVPKSSRQPNPAKP